VLQKKTCENKDNGCRRHGWKKAEQLASCRCCIHQRFACQDFSEHKILLCQVSKSSTRFFVIAQAGFQFVKFIIAYAAHVVRGNQFIK
jgi:hypothetical protein